MLVKIIALTNEEKSLLQKGTRGTRGGIAGEIVQEFLESDLEMARVNMADTGVAFQSLLLRLRHFVKNYEVPVRVSRRRDAIYLIKIEDKTKSIVE